MPPAALYLGKVKIDAGYPMPCGEREERDGGGLDETIHNKATKAQALGQSNRREKETQLNVMG